MKIEKGRVVLLDYVVSTDEGVEVDSTVGQGPVEFLQGYRNIIPGLEKRLEGLEVGYKGRIEVPFDEAYGEFDPAGLVAVAKASFTDEVKLEPGEFVQTEGPNGFIQLQIVDVAGDEVILNANHPLAGVDLVFDIEVVNVREATKDELKHGYLHLGGHHLLSIASADYESEVIDEDEFEKRYPGSR